VRLTCEMAAPFVANSAVDGGVVARPFRGHVSTCLKCQARHAAMSRTARELAAMRGIRYAAPADLEWRVLSSLSEDLALGRSWRKPVAWSAAALSMGAAVAVWVLKPRAS
jgi:hypothetical protein